MTKPRCEEVLSVPRRGYRALNIVFYVILGCFLLLTAVFAQSVPVQVFLRKVKIGMEKKLLVQQLGPPERTLLADDLRQDRFWKDLGAKPPSHEALEYWIRSFPHSDVALVYVNEGGKVTDIDLRNDDNLGSSGSYESYVRASRRIVYCWAGFAFMMLLAYSLRLKYREAGQKPAEVDPVEALSQPPYPVQGFMFDPQAAAFVKKHKDALERLFIKWTVVLCVLILLALAFYGLFKLLEYPWLESVVIILFIPLGLSPPAALIVFFIWWQMQLPRARCSGCGKKMERKWSVAEGRKRLFLICAACKRYVNTGLRGLALRGRQERQTNEQGDSSN